MFGCGLFSVSSFSWRSFGGLDVFLPTEQIQLPNLVWLLPTRPASPHRAAGPLWWAPPPQQLELAGAAVCVNADELRGPKPGRASPNSRGLHG